MNLYMRLIRILVAALFRRRDLAVSDTSVLHFRVWPNDLDPNWHVNNGRYLTLMDLGRIDLTVRMGFLHLVFGRHWMPVLGGAMVSFQRPLGIFQTYSLHTRMVAWDEKWLYLEQRFEAEGKVVATAMVRGLIRGPGRSIPTVEVMQGIGVDLPSPPIPDHIQRWLAADEAMRANTVTLT